MSIAALDALRRVLGDRRAGNLLHRSTLAVCGLTERSGFFNGKAKGHWHVLDGIGWYHDVNRRRER